MIVRPYRRPPEPPTVALLTEAGVIVDEHGTILDPDAWPDDTRAWCSYDTARALVMAGHGEAICWKGEEIRWRHRRLDREGWVNRPSDVHVLRLPLDDLPHREVLRGLARWRDWLAGYRAAPTGSSGSTAWSLLRATIDRELRTSEPFFALPPLPQTLGARQEIGPAGQGRFVGRVELIDLPSAYASELGRLPYGGSWVKASKLEGSQRDLDWWAADNRPVYVRAQVRIPDLPIGPLPVRPRGRLDPMLALGLGAHYPTNGRLQGFWTLGELRAAEAAGCRVVKVLEVWGHFAGGQLPFAPWWEAIQAGREMPGLAGVLAKVTGNALWGRFCMDGRVGRRVIRSRDRRGLLQRSLPFIGGVVPAHDLAETVSGRVRGKLYTAMTELGDRLLSAHTDGAWVRAGDVPSGGWRVKQQARRLDLIGPQTLRYTPVGGRSPVAVVAGVPYSMADETFERQWAEGGFDGRTDAAAA